MLKTKTLQLNDLQEKFLDAIRSDSSTLSHEIDPIASLTPKECVEIYSKGYLARLIESLGETFEATWWVLGDEDFFELAGQYIRANHSEVFDLSEYGSDFPEFLASLKQNDEISFLQDLGRFEWAFKNIFHKRNLESLKVAWPTGTGSAKLVLSDSATLLASRFSAYEIWRRRTQAIETVGEVDWSQPEHLILFKNDSQVNVRILSADEFLVMRHLSNGQTVEASIEALIAEYKEITPERVQSIFSTIAALGVFSVDPGENSSVPSNRESND